jgi:type 1 fimbriae regulatory protein FimB/type 1 fimbriae regulatory protein FimE
VGRLTDIPQDLHHPHSLRHACGYKLINAGMDVRTLQAYLGHVNIQHTARYSALNERAFLSYWD